MFTNIGDLWGPFCCVSYLRCKGDTRSINGSPLWMFNGLCFLLRVMYSWNAITVQWSTHQQGCTPACLAWCGYVVYLLLCRNCSWLQQFSGEQPWERGICSCQKQKTIPYRFTNSWSGSTHGNVNKNQWTNQTNYIDLTRAINSHIVPWNIWWLSPTYGWWLPLNQAGSNRPSQATGAA